MGFARTMHIIIIKMYIVSTMEIHKGDDFMVLPFITSLLLCSMGVVAIFDDVTTHTVAFGTYALASLLQLTCRSLSTMFLLVTGMILNPLLWGCVSCAVIATPDNLVIHHMVIGISFLSS